MIKSTLILIGFFLCLTVSAQDRIYPVIKNFGGIFDAPYATEKPDPDMVYKVVIDIATGDKEKEKPFYSLINVARLINLHAMGGVVQENLHVVLAIHGSAVWSALSHEEYEERFGVENPHIGLFKELKEAGVQIFVCSQSLRGRELDHDKLAPGVKVATSMLTTMTTYQLKGYASLKF